jgi:hypothetical protein
VNEELLGARHPAIGGGVEAPTRKAAVEVGMEGEFAGPGVQHEGEADLGPEVVGVAAQIDQRVGRRREQEIEDERFVPPRQGAQFGGQCEDRMEVVRREQALRTLRHPLVLGGPRTRRTEPAQAGVVERDLAATGLALVEVAAQRLGAAVFDGPHRLALLVRDRVGAPKRLAVRAEDVGDVTARRTRWWVRVHAGPSGLWGSGDLCGDRVERGAGRRNHAITQLSHATPPVWVPACAHRRRVGGGSVVQPRPRVTP